MILGFDISTSIIGWCLLQDNGDYVDIGYIDLRKCNDLYEKLDRFHHFLVMEKDLASNVPVIYVEEPLKMFMKNASMAQTIALLQRFNGMCCGVLYNMLSKPKMINVLTARSQCGIKVPRGTNTKDWVLRSVRERAIIPEIKWEVKKTGNPKDYCFDMADAYVVASAGVKIEGK